MNEPVADAVRAILDGHIVLTRALAHPGHYPAIDVLQSVSRLIGELVRRRLRAAGSAPRRARGVPREGGPDLDRRLQARHRRELDAAIALRGEIDAFLRQSVDEHSTLEATDAPLLELAHRLANATSLIKRGSGHRRVAPPAPRAPPAQSRAPESTVPVGSPSGAPVAIPSLMLASVASGTGH